MTPGIRMARKAGISHTVHEYQHDPAAASWGTEAAEKLDIEPARVFKTLVVRLASGELVVAVVPVSDMVSMKLVARAAGAKKAAMAEQSAVERATGYVLGGVSPLGQRKRLRTFIDESATAFATICVSAGRRGLEIELAPRDLAALTAGQLMPLVQN
ncbi:Cys-tRNA(Pro) deacylase [Marinobacter sp.]|uniref:Cys-tRNA(Pro) deacylase n=1 Tax=Marinobacter sp. TaxID=50741 RepID=UPI00385107A0